MRTLLSLGLCGRQPRCFSFLNFRNGRFAFTLLLLALGMHKYIPERVFCFKMSTREENNQHRTRYSKVAGSVPAGGKLSFRPLYFLHIYIPIVTNNMPYTFIDITVC